MRTTVRIDDRLLVLARRRAREQGWTLGELVERSLRRELSADQQRPSGPPVPTFDGKSGLRAGVDTTSTRALLELLDEGHPLERLR